MPTPTGMLKAGDLIQHKSRHITCEVIERLGNDQLYSVRIRRLDGVPFDNRKSSVILTEAAYHIKHSWQLIR